jgi:tRNA1(Val) A37 N6-methylase TrmN6
MANNEEVVHDLLGYDGIKIVQRPDMFHFSLDSTLLADFVSIPARTKRIIDLGTGNAPIPLFLSLKTKAHITALELQEDVALLAQKSVAINHLEDRIDVVMGDIKGIHKHYPNGHFDIVTANPPFFRYKDTSFTNKHDYQTIARHEVHVTIEDIIKESKRLLKTRGSLHLVHRTERLIEIIQLLLLHKFSIKRMRFVHPREGQPSNMVLIEASNNGNTDLVMMDPLYVHEGEEYSDEVLAIFRYGKEERP